MLFAYSAACSWLENVVSLETRLTVSQRSALSPQSVATETSRSDAPGFTRMYRLGRWAVEFGRWFA
jgi:hypothetical protein